MGREVHGESSSSPNGNHLTVTRIQRRGAGGERCVLTLSDGSSFFISSRLLASLDLFEGKDLPEDELEKIRFAVSLEEARDKALDLLTRREHTHHQLRLKLKKREYSDTVIDEVLHELESRNYLSNRRFAEQWVRSRLARHPEGRARLLAGLLQRGVSMPEANQVLSDELDEEMMQDAVRRAAGKLASRSGMTALKLQKKLYSLGFSRSEVNTAVRIINFK